jgi:DNA-binding NtrC family response regulator
MNASILVVDDEPTVQEALETFLRAEGYSVATAGSGKEALTRIEEQEFDLIVADLVMPGMSGLEVLERSRSIAPAVGVILITGHATVETAIEALRKGAFDYLQKPFQLDASGRAWSGCFATVSRPEGSGSSWRSPWSRRWARSWSGRAARCTRCAPRSRGARPRPATC